MTTLVAAIEVDDWHALYDAAYRRKNGPGGSSGAIV